MLFLTPNQECQSIEGTNVSKMSTENKYLLYRLMDRALPRRKQNNRASDTRLRSRYHAVRGELFREDALCRLRFVGFFG